MKLIKFFFYRIYSVSLSRGEMDPIWAYGLLSMFTIANASCILDILMIITKSKIFDVGPIFILIMCISILHLNSVLLLRNGKPKETIKEFKEMKESRMKWNLFLTVYIIASILMVIYIGGIVREMHAKGF